MHVSIVQVQFYIYEVTITINYSSAAKQTMPAISVTLETREIEPLIGLLLQSAGRSTLQSLYSSRGL